MSKCYDDSRGGAHIPVRGSITIADAPHLSLCAAAGPARHRYPRQGINNHSRRAPPLSLRRRRPGPPPLTAKGEFLHQSE
jgi:hypothetical protein